MEKGDRDKDEEIPQKDDFGDISRKCQEGKDGDDFMDEQKILQQKFVCPKDSDDSLDLPKELKVKQAVDSKNCFSDSVAKGLEIDEQPANEQVQGGFDTNHEEENIAASDQKNNRSRQRIHYPYSNKLPLDNDLKRSNEKFKLIIESDLKHLENIHLSTAEKLHFHCRPAYPTENLLVRFASRVYKEKKDGEEISDEMLPEGWKLLTTAYNKHPTNHYFGAAYWNPQHQQVVIAHQGTDLSSTGALWTDIQGILHNNYVPQMASAVTFTNEIVTVLDELSENPNINLQLSITGHSLGGWLAQITTFTTKYFILESFAGNSSFVKSENVGRHAHTVVFDSPGCKDMWRKMKNDFDLRHNKDNSSLSPSSLDITSYLSLPNLVNTCCSHLGTVYQISLEGLSSERSSWDFGRYIKETHSIDKIEKALDPGKRKNIKEIIDWPLVKKGITIRTLEILLHPSKKIYEAFRKIIFNKSKSMELPRCSEYEYFHKLAKHVGHYNPEPDDKQKYCIVRYQFRSTDKTKCSTSIFTQSELDFLHSYQFLRKYTSTPKLESLFSPLDKEIMETLQVLKSFEIKEKGKIICCNSEKELNRLIPYVKNMLHFFPEISSEINNVQMDVYVRFDVRESVQSFTGRQEQLDQIATAIKQGIVVVTGLGGIGKSELAIKYADDHSTDGNVIWINAETDDTVKDSLRRLLKELNLKTIDQDGDEKTIKLMAKEVFEYFVQRASLFIFDNVEKYSVIKDLLPSRTYKYHVLITSQNHKVFNELEYGKVEILNLDLLPEDKATEFVKKVLNIEDTLQDKDIKELAETLGYLPLALQLAVAYIEESGYFKNLSRYVEVYKKSEQEMESILNRKGLSTYDKTIFLTFKIAIDKIKQEENSNLAVDILNSIAYFVPDNIPKEIFLRSVEDSFKETDEITRNYRANGMLMRALNLLNQYSLINLKDDKVSIHRLVQEVLRLELRKGNERGKTLEEQVLANILEYLKEHIVNRDSAENYMPHIISVWNYACKYERLIEDCIVNNDNCREAYTTYLHAITGSSSYEVVKAVLDKIDCDKIEEIINTKDKQRRTPLYNAALNGNKQILQILLEKGAQVNVKKKHEWTALHAAAKNGHLESVNVLLKNNAKVNDKTGLKFTPLHLASRDGYLDVVSVLLNAGAVINAETRYKYSPLHVAAEKKQLKVVQALLKAKVNIDAKTNYKFTPLHLAAKEGHLEIIKALLDEGADVNALDNGHFTPLHLAVLNSHLEVVNTLLGKGADINAQTTKGNTALHLAVENDDVKIVEVLINKNVNIDLVNKEGKTALKLADENNNLEIRDYIRQHEQNRRLGMPDISG